MKEINIAEILKDKPKGTKLYSPLCGDCWLVTADYKEDKFGEDFPIVVSRSKDDDINAQRTISLTALGTFFKGSGECLLFPSKGMYDWEKFAWERGDVLATDINTYCIFEDWENDNYTQFKAKYICRKSDLHFYSDEVNPTCNWAKVKENDNDKSYIDVIERAKGGKLNLKTLKIEKQPEFKDGDILHSEDYICGYIYICKGPQREVNTAYCYKLTGGGYSHICDLSNFYDCTIPSSSIISDKTRYATEEEKQQLFDALAKEGKRWNAETKTLEDLPKKHEFKPFERVLVRDHDDEEWCASFFSHYADKEKTQVMTINDYGSQQCIPYEGNEHLLGTTDKPKR